MLIPVSVPGGAFLQPGIVRKAAAAQSTAAIFFAHHWPNGLPHSGQNLGGWAGSSGVQPHWLHLAGEHIFPDAPPSVEIGTAMSAEFTKGEMKVLRCLVRGLSYNEIAKELGIEPSTVKFHVINMLQKTNLENKLQLAIAATEAKLVVELSDT